MFSTKNLVHDVKDVPHTWIFEHYCKLKEKLNGEDVKVKSLFSDEKTPSMCVYTKEGVYRFKDFSSGRSGSAIDLVKEIFKLNYYKAIAKVVEDYNDYLLHNNNGYDIQEFKEANRYRVTDYIVRGWTKSDGYLWTQFNIGSRILEKYCVLPLESYKMVAGDKELIIKGGYIYGYFRMDGSLYKIYQPKTSDRKFIQVAKYIQGSEQTEGRDYLLIVSSLKDIMSSVSLKLLNLDYVAPDSENTMILKPQMNEWIKKYKKVMLMFDNDNPGILAMEKYKKLYPTLGCFVLPLSKDISDSVKDFKVSRVLHTLVPLIHKKINNLG